MSIAQDMVDGLCCQLCGVYFKEEHGYPVVCEGCYNSLNDKEKEYFELAIYPEL